MLDEEQKRAKRHETAHRYSLAEFGLEAGTIESELGDFFERYHWKEAAGAAPAPTREERSPAHGG